ncbi:hypothetical protein [Paenibacillus agricola]|uniref:Restriction endonuclease n=1 Tax=Paenibacillus agricola TaxID=2716264 RepID=A0ABX0JG82_9BACL|nr:hypothetical protein [Paenibacillus agricola]NHN33249.1 hypothetical protein [Paenibacillus agricola]
MSTMVNPQARLIREKIKALHGIEFEYVANFILTLVEHRYHGTRFTKDDGVDGIKIQGIKNRTLYSSHAPANSTDWKAIKIKSIVDAKDAIQFANGNNKEIKEWCILLNRDLAGNEVEFFHQLCAELGIKKLRLVTLYEWEKMIFTHNIELVVSRFLGISQYRIPISELQPHVAARELLSFLSELRFSNESERLEQLNLKEKEIIELAFTSPDFDKYTNLSLSQLIMIHTRINENYTFAYKYTSDGSFITLPKDGSESEGPYVSKDNTDNFTIKVQNLRIIYRLIQSLKRDVKNYSIHKALKCMFDVRQSRGRYIRDDKGLIPINRIIGGIFEGFSQSADVEQKLRDENIH